MRTEIIEVLTDLIAIPSISGEETQVMEYLEERYRRVDAHVSRIMIPEDQATDPEYNSVMPEITPGGTFNLRVTPGVSAGSRPRVIINAHADVVPPSPGMADPFAPAVTNDAESGPLVLGRGACDDKGSIVVTYVLARLCAAFPQALTCDPEFHIVVEEENGGNGTLAMIRNEVTADACVVLEPTSLRVAPVARGAVWFSATFQGTAGHSSHTGAGRSALLNAIEAIHKLDDLHTRLAQEPRDPLFSRFDDPAPLTIGKMVSGSWPSTTPDHGTLEGVLGFLPGRSRHDICDAIEQCFDGLGANVAFPYRHECSVTGVDHILPRTVSNAARAAVNASHARGLEPAGQIEGFPASCDAWYYSCFAGVPTVVFGPGDLGHAHAATEQIRVQEIEIAAITLYLTLCRELREG
jgi:acetylornithine deacetylase